MYSILICILSLSIIILLIEAVYVVCNVSSKIHTYLFLYILCCLVNNVGYLLEMTAKSSEVAYAATKLLYLGKINIALVMLLFILRYCKVILPKFISISLFVFHQLLYGIILTNDWHRLYYSSIRFEETGLFPHNVYGHGPVYFIAILIPYVYLMFCFVLLVRTYHRLKTKEEKNQMLFLLVAPSMSLLGTLVFFTGQTGGFDTGNVGLMFSALFLSIALFKYRLIDTVDMVKNTLADSLEDGLIAIDAYGGLSYINETAKVLLPGAVLAKRDEIADIAKDLEGKCKSKESITYSDRSYVVRMQDLYQGRFYRGRLFVLADVTDTLRYTRQIEAERDRADKANEAKSSFLSNMSHEIRTPMNAIVGMTDILLRGTSPEETTSYLESIKYSGNSLLNIINDILDFSKIESGKLEIIKADYPVLPLLNDLKILFANRVGDKPVRMLYEISDTLPAILYGDSVRIRQVLINLVNNAIKFTERGFVKLKIDSEPAENNRILLHVTVQDSGQGIREADLDKLFRSFSQVDSEKNHQKEGTGLGLSISKQLVKLMGGTINVKSTYGKGSEFSFTIPQQVVNATPAKFYKYSTAEAEATTFTAPNANILLVEDNEINVKVAQGLLKPFMLRIDVAQNGQIALDMIAKKDYDLVLMDHMMPVMDGIEATERLRAMKDPRMKALPIIALTANAMADAKKEFLDAGMNDFISKPIVLNDISAILKKWLPKELISN